MENLKAGLGCLGALIVVGIIGFFMAFQTVPVGSVGVVSHFGEVDDATLTPGIHFMLPFINSVHIINTQVQSHEFGVADNQPIEAASREYQSVYLSGKFNYHVDGAFASVLFKTVGEDFAARIIDPAFKDVIKEVVPQYGISEILPKRDEIRSKTIIALNANLARYHIIIDDVYLANVSFSDAYEAAIEGKQVAQQQVETEKQILAQKQIQQQQKVVEAQGNAQAQIEAAKGNAQAAIENAQGTAKANALITASLTALLIQYEFIRVLPDAQVIYLPADFNNFLLNIPAAKVAP